MIEIKFIPDELTLSVSGHAGMEEKGKDIVCSAVSILFYTLIGSLMNAEEAFDEGDITYRYEDGDGYISCKPKKGWENTVKVIYQTVLIGMELIAENYPEYVKLIIV